MNKQNTFVQQLLLLSSLKNEEAAKNEWVITNIVNDGLCLCQKTNPYYYQLLNKINKNVILVGQDCLKHLQHLKPVAVVLHKQHHYKTTSKTPDKRICHSCLKHNIGSEEPVFKTICKACWIKNVRDVQSIPILGNKLCEECFTLNIKPNDNRKKCLQCYKKTNTWRACTVCQQQTISTEKPDYVDKCHKCFLEYKEQLKNQEMRECTQCKQLNIPVTEPVFKTCCKACYKQNMLQKQDESCSVKNLNMLKSIIKS
jgi:hypothetical protein